MTQTTVKTMANRCALAAFLFASTVFATCIASAELVEGQLNDIPRVVTVQATSPQDPIVPGSSPTAVEQSQVPPQIREPFANPLVASPELAAPSATFGNASLGLGGLGLSASMGVTAGSFSAAPNMMGDLFGGGVSVLGKPKVFTFAQHLPGFVFTGTGGTEQLVFEYGTSTANDLFTIVGSGVDITGDTFIDQFQIAEPLPPTDAPLAPGPGYVFSQGQANYTGANQGQAPIDGAFTSGDIWFVKYEYVSTGAGFNETGVVVAGPDVATRRVKLSENFSPEVRDRCFLNYNFFNDVYGGLGDVSRYVLGFERILIEDLVSIEVRVPMAGTLSSRQQIDAPGDRDFELGNTTVIGKAILLRSDRFTLTGGSGITAPLADDARIVDGENELLRIENESVHLLPFIGLLHRFNQRTFFQAYTQVDVDLQGNPVLANLSGGPLNGIGRFTDSTLMHLDLSAHRIVYENRRSDSLVKGVIANAELHYTATVQDSDTVAGQGVVIANLKDNFNVVNATMGAHVLIGDHFVMTPGFAVPLRDGLDEQFDFEAILQLNYLH